MTMIMTWRWRDDGDDNDNNGDQRRPGLKIIVDVHMLRIIIV